MFGGVDKAKFKGPLITLHTMPLGSKASPSMQYSEQQLRLLNMATQVNGRTQRNFNLARETRAALLDSGSKGLLLPSDWVSTIFNDMHILEETYATSGIPIVPCDSIDPDYSLEFTLADESANSTRISVLSHDLLIPMRLGLHNGTKHINVNGTYMCEVAVSDSGFTSDSKKGHTILGDVFLHSAYTYYNLDQHTISIAEAVFNSTAEDVVAIGNGLVPKLFGTG